jgi:disulfide bond formation protein DsbB
MTHSLQFLFAVAAVAANVSTLVLLAALLGSGRVRVLAKLREQLAPWVVPAAAIVAVVTMSGSLYFSEVAHFIPCPLCWMQRCVAYPTAIILVIAAFRRDLAVRIYIIPLVLIGTVISSYHFLIERGVLKATESCKIGASCADVWFTEFGVVTLAYMAFSSFTLIAALLALPPRSPS